MTVLFHPYVRMLLGQKLMFRACSLCFAFVLLSACVNLPEQSSKQESGSNLLSSWRSIESGIQESGNATAAPGGYIQLGRPVSVAAWADYVYIADAGRQAVLRYDLRRESFSVFYRLQITPATRILATTGEYLYITDPVQGRILYLDRDGRLLREIKDFNLKQPVAIREDFRRGRILVADGFYRQVLAFNKLGRLIKVIHPVDDTSAEIGGLIDMVVKGEQIYLLDRNLRQVVVTDLDGNYRHVIGKDKLQQPVALQVDDRGRVWIADAFDNSLLVFTQEFGHRFSVQRESMMTMQLAGMDLHENWLYLADAAAARVLVMKLHYPVTTGGSKK